MEYTNSEMVDMIEMYFLNGRSGLRARNAYAERYPERRTPSEKIFVRIVQRLRDWGTFQPNLQDLGREQTRRIRNVEEQILDAVDNHPETSTRRLAIQHEVSQSTVSRMLRKQSLHPYHVQKVQALLPTDLPRRLEFCHWFLEKHNEDPNFLRYVMFTDEAGFTRDGIFNCHNTHIWADENPHAIRDSHHQQQFSINVWAGIVGNQLLGPYELPGRLNGNTYLDFLNGPFQDMIDEIPLQIRRNVWLQQDGAPPHSTRRITEWLNENFPNRWIGRFGPVSWPPRSPDLTSCDFFLWGYMKNLVYSEPIDNLQQLRRRVENAAAHIRNNPDIFENVRHSLLRRARACVEAGGDQFQHLL